MTDYFIINLYDIEYLSYCVTDKRIHITFKNEEILNISQSTHNINVNLLFIDIVKNLKDEFLIVDEKYYFIDNKVIEYDR